MYTRCTSSAGLTYSGYTLGDLLPKRVTGAPNVQRVYIGPGNDVQRVYRLARDDVQRVYIRSPQTGSQSGFSTIPSLSLESW